MNLSCGVCVFNGFRLNQYCTDSFARFETKPQEYTGQDVFSNLDF